jgi:hypothetical protein
MSGAATSPVVHLEEHVVGRTRGETAVSGPLPDEGVDCIRVMALVGSFLDSRPEAGIVPLQLTRDVESPVVAGEPHRHGASFPSSTPDQLEEIRGDGGCG